MKTQSGNTLAMRLFLFSARNISAQASMPQITVGVVNQAGVDSKALRQGLEFAAMILRWTGVSLASLDCSLSVLQIRRRLSRLIRLWALVVVFSCPLPMQYDAQTPREISAASYVERANGLLTKGDFKRAIADFGIALQFDPRCASAYFGRGVARQMSGELQAAIGDYSTAIELNPKFALAYSNRAHLLSHSGELDAALLDYDRALELNPRLT
jgi:tetratricopeptide (TPR) repeat protein